VSDVAAEALPDDGSEDEAQGDLSLARARRQRQKWLARYSRPPGATDRLGPDFLGIGVQKAATTWLHGNLALHPDVFMAPIKEVQYFSALYLARTGDDQWEEYRARQATAARRQLEIVARRRPEDAAAQRQALDTLEGGPLDDARYCALFAPRSMDQIAGEISPAYALLPRVGISHILRMNPHMRFLVMLRDPAARLVSAVQMNAGRDATPERLWEILRGRRAFRFALASDYAAWLSRWFGMAGRERFHIAYQGDVAERPMQVLDSVCRFLGIPYSARFFNKAEEEVFRTRRPSDEVAEMRAFVRERFAHIYEALERDFPDIAAKLRETG
jgi:hypothetical protein